MIVYHKHKAGVSGRRPTGSPRICNARDKSTPRTAFQSVQSRSPPTDRQTTGRQDNRRNFRGVLGVRIPPPHFLKVVAQSRTGGRQTRVSGAAYLEHVCVGVGVILDDDGLGPTECVRHRVLLCVLYQLINTTTN